MLNIDKLLKQKGWTGSDLGRLQIVTTLKAFQKVLDGEESPDTVVDRSHIREMLKTLDPVEIAVYKGYIGIHEWFRVTYPAASATEQAAHLNLSYFVNLITVANISEEVYQYISELPAIMTQKQYEDLVARRKHEIMHPDGEPIGFNLFNLLEQAIHYEVRQTENNPRKKTLLKPLKKKLENELVTDQHILSRYNKVSGYEGYYTLPDGRRSDQMTHEEWSAALEEYYQKPTPEEREEYLEKRYLINNDLIYSGMNEIEADKKAEEIASEGMPKAPTEWHEYEAPPADLNKWEILEYYALGEWYCSLDGECYEGMSYEESLLSDIKAFKEEYPELVEIILKDMERYIKGVSTVPIEEWINTIYEWEDLYSMNFYDFREDYIGDTEIFDGNYRALFNGIAIIKPSSLNVSRRIDKETGYYQPPEIRHLQSQYGLEAYFTECEDYAENVEALETTRSQLLESLYFMNGWNTALDLIAQAFDLEEIKVGKLRTENIKARIEAYNALVKSLYRSIKGMDYPDKDLQKKKLEVLKDILCPISLDKIKIPKKQIEKAKEDMKNFKAFLDESKDLRLTLCSPTEEL